MRMSSTSPSWHAAQADGSTLDEDLAGLLAIRRAYGAALAEQHPDAVAPAGSLFPAVGTATDRCEPSEGELARYLFQVAVEVAYQRRLCRGLRHPSLRLHALKGRLQGLHSVSINISYRITLELIIDGQRLIPMDIGSHDAVYRS